jgi:acetyltransferase-like isoleucine patch superfamily enzyme
MGVVALMLLLRKIVRRLLSFHKYPRYIVDIYVSFILQYIWRSRGIVLGKKIAWLGKPIMTVAEGAFISIGPNAMLCSRSIQNGLGVNHPVVIRAMKPGAILTIGSEARMSGVSICAATKITIGDRCVVGSNTVIVDTDWHSMDPLIRFSPNDFDDAISKPVIIGDNVFIGNDSIILKGVTVGDAAVIGSNSVVTKDVPAGVIVAGNPAKPVGQVKSLQDVNNS